MASLPHLSSLEDTVEIPGRPQADGGAALVALRSAGEGTTLGTARPVAAEGGGGIFERLRSLLGRLLGRGAPTDPNPPRSEPSPRDERRTPPSRPELHASPAASKPAPTPEPLPLHPVSAEPPPEVGGVSRDVLRMNQLAPVSGQLDGAPLAIADQPESFRKSGVLLSTIGPVAGRDDTTYDFPGEARFFGLANNRTGRPQRNWMAVENTSDEPLELSVRGTIYSKHYTETDGSISADYKKDGGFRGPHAITAMSFMKAEPGENGYIEKTVSIPPGETRVIADTYMHPGGETFQLLDLEAGTPGQTFRIANAVTDASPSAADLAGLRDRPEAAGIPRDYYPAGHNALGRPHGIVEGGQTFTGAREVDLQPHQRSGELIMATRFKNAGATDEIGQITLGGGVPEASYAEHPKVIDPRDPTTSDGNYGTTYRLDYTLRNDTDAPLETDVVFTAPRQGSEVHRPLGGELTIPLKIDGVPTPVRVNDRGEGVVVKRVTVPPGGRVPLQIEVTSVGNTVPPAGIELRARPAQ